MTAKVPQIQFPIILIAWYFSKEDPIIKEQAFSHLSAKQLILSKYVDWQYIESLQRKITVINEQ